MEAEFEFHARLFSALENFIATNDTDFGPPEGESEVKSGRADIFLPSRVREGVVIEVKRADIDPHSFEVIRQAHRYARDMDVSLFATANANDVFLFKRTETSTSITELDRRHYDLSSLSLESFIGEFLQDVVDLQQGKVEAFAFDELIVNRLRSFHRSIYPTYVELIHNQHETDDSFREPFVEWARENDYPFDPPDVEHTFEIAGKQYAYLLMNRIVFYQLVREQGVETESGLPLDPIFGGVSLEELDDHLRDCFEDIMDEIDYEAIFRDDSEFFKIIPENEFTKQRIHAFTKSIEQEPLDEINVDVVGSIYQELIPIDERKELGQFYTPHKIGEILSTWAIRSKEDRFLDPCCGSGSITVEAYKRYIDLDELTHRDILDRITAVDINKFPLHLTALNLATRDIHEPTEQLFAYNEDFFNLDPDTRRFKHSRLGVRGSSEATDTQGAEPIGKFQATAANPPYVRQEYLYPNRDHFRKHLKKFGPSSKEIYYDGGEYELDGRSDLYCYFLTHTTQFLEQGGRLAWIISTKWMVADYGPSLKRFLFNHYRVQAVVGFRKRLFEDALVDAILLLMERCDDIEERKQTETSFIRVNQPMSVDDIMHIIEQDYDIPDDSYMKIHSRPNYRAISVKQSRLMENIDDKIHHFINAPALYTAVLEDNRTVPLKDIATVTRGKKTGANPIFILDEDDLQSWNVESEFLRPAIKSVKEVDGFEHTSSDVSRWMLDMSDYVEEVVSMSGLSSSSDLEGQVLDSLHADGYHNVLSYLKWAEKQDARTNKSLSAYDPWFNLEELDTAPIVCPQAMDTRRFFFRGDNKVAPSNRFLLVQPNDDVDEDVLIALLNSSLSKIIIESHGRVTGGGAVNLAASDLQTLRVVDPVNLSENQIGIVKRGFDKLVDGDDSGQSDIDSVVIDVLELGTSPDELQEIAEKLKLTRRAKGKDVDVLVKELDELEGHLEMVFQQEGPQPSGLSEFGA